MATRESTELYFPKSQNGSSSSSTNKSTVEKDDKTQNLAVTGQTAEILSDYFSRGDYLELLDFDDPAASPSSSSDNSSCVTMSSDECFDSLALLKELDSEISQDSVQMDANCKLDITSPEAYIGIKAPSEDIVGTHSSLPEDHRVKNTATQTQKAYDHKEASTSRNGGREVVKGKKKQHKNKNKFMCFMPFYFIF